MFRFFKDKAETPKPPREAEASHMKDRDASPSSPDNDPSDSPSAPHDKKSATNAGPQAKKKEAEGRFTQADGLKAKTVSARLDAAGYFLPQVAKPVASYVPAVEVPSGDKKVRMIQTSGQLPMVEGSLAAAGKVGHSVGMISEQYAYQLTKVCALNALAAAADMAGGVDRVTGVVKVTVFVASRPDFTDQARVANGASDLFGELFDKGHARSAVGVAVLPLDAPVEVEVVFTAM